MKTKTLYLSTLFLISLLVSAIHCRAGEIWITNGSSYLHGSTYGSAANPVVVDNATDFNSYLNSITDPSPHIHLMAGTYQTGGFNVKSGWTIEGDGMDRTLIQGVNFAAGIELVIGSINNPTNVFLTDFTLDCNFQNQPGNANLKSDGIELKGDNLHLTRIKAISFGSTLSLGEAFILNLQCTNTLAASTNMTIEGCVLTQPAPNGFANNGYINGISIFGSCGLPSETDTNHVTSVGPGWVIGGEIKNCKVYGINATGHGITWTGVSDTKIHDNMVWGCPNLLATYSEDSIYSDLEIANNFFDGVAGGIHFLDSDSLIRLRNNLSIHDNDINTVSGSAILIDTAATTSLHNGVSIQNNDVTTPVGGSYTTWGIDLIGATNAVFANNTVSSSSTTAPLIYMQTVTNVTVRNNESINGPNLNIYDNTSGLTQGEQESTIVYSFIPSTTGWYRIATSGNALNGKAVIAYDDRTSGNYSDVEATFAGNGFLGADVGPITCTRDLNYGTAISALRIGTDGWTGSSAPVYFDIDVAVANGAPVYVKLTMDAETAVFDLATVISGFQPPTGLASTPANYSVLTLAHDGALQTIGSLVVSNAVIVTANGLINSSQLDSAGLTGIATLTPSSGAIMLGNGSAWTATAANGDATMTSAGKITVTNMTSTTGPIAGFQLVTATATLSANSPRVIQTSGTSITLNMPSTVIAGKEFLIQNINTTGALTIGSTGIANVTVSAGNCAIAVGRSDGKWQVHQF